MRTRHYKNADSIIESCNFVIKNPTEFKGKYNSVFNNNNPIYLEIGMGKGNFIIGNALKNPNINYIGIEKQESIVARAIKKIEKYNLKNIRIMKIDANKLADVFDKEIDVLFLNFSDPWPKKRHSKRRLTSEYFLRIYDNLFKGKNHIYLKTDNKGLFESSLISLNNYGYKFNEISLDLHNTSIDNIMTEYEEKFSSMGQTINYLECEK